MGVKGGGWEREGQGQAEGRVQTGTSGRQEEAAGTGESFYTLCRHASNDTNPQRGPVSPATSPSPGEGLKGGGWGVVERCVTKNISQRTCTQHSPRRHCSSAVPSSPCSPRAALGHDGRLHVFSFQVYSIKLWGKALRMSTTRAKMGVWYCTAEISHGSHSVEFQAEQKNNAKSLN